jgi:hypothetical protein
MHTLHRGFLAGVLASLVLALFDFVTDGTPGNGFPAVLRWFGLTIANPTISRLSGLLLLLVLGGVFGLLFGALQRGKLITTGRALLTGLALGVLWWLLFEVVLANLTNHASSPFSLSFGQFLASFPLTVLFGVLLGAISIQWQGRQAASRSTRTPATANPVTPDFLQTGNIVPTPDTATPTVNVSTTNNFPPPVVSPPPVSHGGTYVVRSNETLSSIAHKLLVTPDHLWQSNRYTISQAMWDYGVRPRIPFTRGPMPPGLKVYAGEKLAY